MSVFFNMVTDIEQKSVFLQKLVLGQSVLLFISFFLMILFDSTLLEFISFIPFFSALIACWYLNKKNRQVIASSIFCLNFMVLIYVFVILNFLENTFNQASQLASIMALCIMLAGMLINIS